MGNCGAKTKLTEDVARGLPSELTLKKKAELQAVLDADGIKREVCVTAKTSHSSGAANVHETPSTLIHCVRAVYPFS